MNIWKRYISFTVMRDKIWENKCILESRCGYGGLIKIANLIFIEWKDNKWSTLKRRFEQTRCKKFFRIKISIFWGFVCAGGSSKATVNKYFCLSKKAFVVNVNMSVPLCDSSFTNTAKHLNWMGLLRWIYLEVHRSHPI